MRTLIVAPHMDDEVLSCGGLIQKRVASGDEVYVLTMFGRVYDYGRVSVEDSFEKEYEHFKAAQLVLGYQRHQCMLNDEGEPTKVGYYRLLEEIEDVMCQYDPHELVVPGKLDLNQDHRFLADVCDIACRPFNLGSIRRILAAGALDSELKTPNYFIPMNTAELEVKLNAMNCYETERREGVHTRSPENIEAYARVVGSKCGHEFAEGFLLKLSVEG